MIDTEIMALLAFFSVFSLKTLGNRSYSQVNLPVHTVDSGPASLLISKIPPVSHSTIFLSMEMIQYLKRFKRP